MSDKQPCDDCIDGRYLPSERFHRVLTHPQGPEFLNVCSKCDALWYEALRGARRLTEAEAQSLFPELELGIRQRDVDGRIFAGFGIEIFKRSGRRFFLRYDPGEPFSELREAEITESEAIAAQKGERDASDVLLNCTRRGNSRPCGFREAPLSLIRSGGTRKGIRMNGLVRIASGTSRLRPGWAGTLTFSEELNSFVELSSPPVDAKAGGEPVALEVDDSYALRSYQVTRLDIPK